MVKKKTWILLGLLLLAVALFFIFREQLPFAVQNLEPVGSFSGGGASGTPI